MSDPRGPQVLRAAIDAARHRESLVKDLAELGIEASDEWTFAQLEATLSQAREGVEFETAIGDVIQRMTTLADTLAMLGRDLLPVVNDAFSSLDRFLRGPKAPPRRRPQRIAKKITQRDGRLRYPVAAWRHA